MLAHACVRLPSCPVLHPPCPYCSSFKCCGSQASGVPTLSLSPTAPLAGPAVAGCAGLISLPVLVLLARSAPPRPCWRWPLLQGEQQAIFQIPAHRPCPAWCFNASTALGFVLVISPFIATVVAASWIPWSLAPTSRLAWLGSPSAWLRRLQSCRACWPALACWCTIRVNGWRSSPQPCLVASLRYSGTAMCSSAAGAATPTAARPAVPSARFQQHRSLCMLALAW